MTTLPDEVVEYILEDGCLGFGDIVRFGTTCKQYHKLATDNNKLWETKFFQRWPLLKEIYQEKDRRELQAINWKAEVQASLSSRYTLLELLSQMSSKHYKKQELSDFGLMEFDPMICPKDGAHPLAYYFLVDELISLIKQPALTSNLTHRYYAFKVVRYLKQNHLKCEWEKFLRLPPQEQILEIGASLVAQWSQPERHLLYSHISASLDTIANQTKDLLREEYPAHSIFSLPPEQFMIWKRNNIDDNQWSITESRQLMDVLCKVLFQKLGFHGDSEMYYSSENSFINCVLERKHGIPITLAIVFESVARRLGIRCEPVSFPSHFLLRWKERYNSPDSKDAESFYIDVFNGGQFLTKRNCPRIGGATACPIQKYNVHNAASAVEVVTRMANNLEVAARQYTRLYGRAARLRSALELLHMVQPDDANVFLQLGRFYWLRRMDITDLVSAAENMQKDLDVTSREHITYILQTLQTLYGKHLQSEEVRPKERTPAVKYAVGLIMKHKPNGNLCVITGWDLRCERSIDLMDEIDIHELDDDADQPFYYVCVDGGSFRYAAQENLFLAPQPWWINHHEIGRYFSKFADTHYVPNEEKAREYPEDEQVRNSILASLKNVMQCDNAQQIT